MKCILLCAGYHEDKSHALHEIDNEPIILNTINKIEQIKEIDEIYLVTNNTYYNDFNKLLKNNNSSKKITLINDNVKQPGDALGAIGDIMYTINIKDIDNDVMIIAGDNWFDFSLIPIVNYFNKKKAPVVCSAKFEDENLLKKFAVAQLNKDNQIVDLVEKPMYPESNIGIYAIYIYPKEVLYEFNNFLSEGNKPNAPGYFVQYLYKKAKVYAYNVEGNYKVIEK